MSKEKQIQDLVRAILSNKAKLTRSDKLKTKSDNAKDVMIKKIEDVSREAMMEKCGCKNSVFLLSETLSQKT